MKSIAQAWNTLLQRKLTFFCLGAFGFILLLTSFSLPLSAFFLALSLTVLQQTTWALYRRIDIKCFLFQIKMSWSWIMTLVILLIPASILMGSAVGILQSPYIFMIAGSLATLLITLALFFTFVFSQILFISSDRQNLGRLIDILFLSALKNWIEILGFCLLSALLVVLSIKAWGLGLIVAIPLLSLSNIIYFERFTDCGQQQVPPQPKPASVD